MGIQFNWYDGFSESWARGDVILKSDTFKAALVTSSYTFDSTHTSFSQVTNELAGNGYSQVTMSGISVTRSGKVATVDFADISFATVITAPWTFRRMVIYDDTPTTPVADPLVCSILFDNTPGNIVVPVGIKFVAEIPTGLATLTLQDPA